MAQIDDLLEQAEAQDGSSSWVLITKYQRKEFYVDSDRAVNVVGRKIEAIREEVSVQGENHSQYIEFVMDRYYDGIDIAEQTLAIHYEVGDVSDEDAPINVYKNDTQIKFGWVVENNLTQYATMIEFCIWARGTLADGNAYVLKTLPQKYEIQRGLTLAGGIVEPSTNWYVQFALTMDEKVAQATTSADVATQSANRVGEVEQAVSRAYEEVSAMHTEVESMRDEVERMKDQVEGATGVGIAAVGKLGVSKPDGETIDIDEDGTLKCKVEGIKDYSSLENKPKINGVELDGDKSLEDLGFEGTTDYQVLENKPSIAGIELSGDKSYDELGLAGKEAVARNFESVNQELEALDTFTQQLDQDISALDTELEQTNQQLQSTTDKVDIIIEKADLGIKETASGEDIHLIDSAEGKAVEFALYGKAKQNTTSGKNLLIYPYHETTHTDNGITWTDNGDGTVTANGTATALSSFLCKIRISPNGLVLPNGTYKISGCPSGGSNATYVMGANVTVNGANNLLAHDIGNGATITVNGDDYYTDKANVGIYFEIKNGTKVENLVFKPMVRLASITDDTWEQPTNGATPRPDYPQEIEVSGESYNLIPYPYVETTKTKNGVDFTVNEDGSVTINGTSTATNFFYLVGNGIDESGFKLSGKYIASSENYISATSYMRVGISNGSYYDVTKETEMEFPENSDVYVCIRLGKGEVINNVTFYPMIRKASVKNDRYMPYGKGSVEVKSCGKNLLKNTATSRTINGATLEPIFNKDGSLAYYNLNGTLTVQSDFVIVGDWGSTDDNAKIPNGKYIITKGVNDSGIAIIGRNGSANIFSSSSDVIETEVTMPIGFVFFRINPKMYNNVKLYPMIRLATDTDSTYQPYKETLSTIPTENGLAGIKVSINGNYTDSNGQQWICDEVVKYADGSGAYIQRIGKTIFTDAVWHKNTENNFYTTKDSKKYAINSYGLCSNLISDKSATFNNLFINGGGDIRVNTTASDVSTISEIMKDSVFYGILAEPITTPLTAEEIAEISTFYPVTNISNDFDCGMRIEYVGDSIITTNTEIPIVEPKDEEELESGDNIVTLFGKIKKLLKNVGKGVVDVVDNLLSTSTTLPLSANQGRVLDEKISTINERLEELGQSLSDISNLINEQLTEQISNISTRLSTLEQNQKTIIYSDTEPETVEENTIVMVYETEE